MITIHKYQVRPGRFAVSMPADASVLTCQVQAAGGPQLWALVDTDRPWTERRFVLIGTGHPIENASELVYISTFQTPDGTLVFHLFEHDPELAAA